MHQPCMMRCIRNMMMVTNELTNDHSIYNTAEQQIKQGSFIHPHTHIHMHSFLLDSPAAVLGDDKDAENNGGPLEHL